MKNNDDLWDISNRPSTKTKLEILEKVFDVWLAIWNKQNWTQNEWYIVDLFAGRGEYIDNGNKKDGSPIIFLKKIASKKDILRDDLKFKIFLVEKNKKNFNNLEETVKKYIKDNSLENIVEPSFYHEDCNKAITQIIKSINNTKQHPLFILVDPTGLQIKKSTIQKIVNLQNPKDILFNYIVEGVQRTSGIVGKKYRGEELNTRELKTVKTLEEFIGDDVNIIDKDHKNIPMKNILMDYVEVFTSQNLKVVGYDVKYSNRNDILYYLLFAVKNEKIANIVKDIYARQKEKELGPTLFGGKEFYINYILTILPETVKINKKSLLYKTKVEYGNWTINHIIGCKHGCNFPCYAMMMAKRFGWIKDYEDWRTPRIVANSLELLEKEIPKYKDQIDFVHLCFMSDPFMYDFEKKQLVPEVKELTLKIIEKLNKEGIKVTTLTKGIYPEDILDKKRFLQKNEYGITLVSLNNNFKKEFEPFSAPYKERIDSLKRLAQAGLDTWVSIEPYPTPTLDETAGNINDILENIRFVKKIIFGKLNYNRLANYDSDYISIWENNEEFYKEMAKKVIDFCRKNNIKCHIKSGTPLSKFNKGNIFKE